MNYELAKQLKEEGFPFDKDVIEWEPGYIPTLSELIEACGDGFHGLWVIQDEWEAFSELDNGYIVGKNGEGKTPEEAVAKLWLALNRK